MSTDWAEYDDDSLEDHLEMAVGLVEQDEDAWSDFHSEIVAEREKRIQTTKKAEAERRRREAARYAASPQGKLAALKKDLKVAEGALAAAERPETLARVHPDTARDLDPLRTARVEAAARVADLKSQIEVAEKRLPFTKTTDDQLLDLAAEGEAILAPLREAVAKHDAQAREQGIEDNSFAAQKVGTGRDSSQEPIETACPRAAKRTRQHRIRKHSGSKCPVESWTLHVANYVQRIRPLSAGRTTHSPKRRPIYTVSP